MDKPDKPVYILERVLGKLFRQSKDISRLSSLEVAQVFWDKRLEVDGFEVHLEDAFRYRTTKMKLRKLMDHYRIETKAEIISGNILTMAKHFNRRNDEEDVRLAVESLWKDFRTWLEDGGGIFIKKPRLGGSNGSIRGIFE